MGIAIIMVWRNEWAQRESICSACSHVKLCSCSCPGYHLTSDRRVLPPETGAANMDKSNAVSQTSSKCVGIVPSETRNVVLRNFRKEKIAEARSGRLARWQRDQGLDMLSDWVSSEPPADERRHIKARRDAAARQIAKLNATFSARA